MITLIGEPDMPKAIQTKYLPVTPTKPLRMKAWDSDGNQITMSVDEVDAIVKQYGFSTASIGGDNTDHKRHYVIAYALRNKMGWTGNLIGGCLKGSMVFVFERK